MLWGIIFFFQLALIIFVLVGAAGCLKIKSDADYILSKHEKVMTTLAAIIAQTNSVAPNKEWNPIVEGLGRYASLANTAEYNATGSKQDDAEAALWMCFAVGLCACFNLCLMLKLLLDQKRKSTEY